MRYLHLVIGLASPLFILLNGQVSSYLKAFLLAVPFGLCIDYIGIAKLKYWHYPRVPFPSKTYALLILPAWGILAVTTNLLYDLILKITVSDILALSLSTVLLLLESELLNIKTNSWKYNYNKFSRYTFCMGWSLLIVCIRIFYLL